MNAIHRTRARKPLPDADFVKGPLCRKGPQKPQKPAKRKLETALDCAADAADAADADDADCYVPRYEGPPTKRGMWEPFEDSALIALVQEHGPKNWSFISKGVPGRIGKQCRERWKNYLDPGIKSGGWTPAEELQVAMSVNELGFQWATIARRMPGRTDSAVKNWYHQHVSRATVVEEDLRAIGEALLEERKNRDALLVSNPISATGWDIEEDARLVKAIMLHDTRKAGSWEAIRDAVGTRTLSACKRHWHIMRAEIKPVHKHEKVARNEELLSPNHNNACELGLDAFDCTTDVLLEEIAKLNAESNLLAQEVYSEGLDHDLWSKSSGFVIGDAGGVCFTFPRKRLKRKKNKEREATASPPLPLLPPLPLEAVGTLVAPAPAEAEALCTSTYALEKSREWTTFLTGEARDAVLEATEARLAQRCLHQQQQTQRCVREYYQEVKRRDEEVVEKSAFA